MSMTANSSNKLNNPKGITLSKILIMTSYCALVCAAVLFSFKSVFLSFADGIQNGITPDKSSEALEALSKYGASGKNIQEQANMQLEADYQTVLTEKDIDLLAQFISAEAGDEPYIGQVAVGAVILNRLKHSAFPNSVSDVIYQPQAFSCTVNGSISTPASESAYRAAHDALNNTDPTDGAIYFFNPGKTVSLGFYSRPVVLSVGSLVFCE